MIYLKVKSRLSYIFCSNFEKIQNVWKPQKQTQHTGMAHQLGKERKGRSFGGLESYSLIGDYYGHLTEELPVSILPTDAS